MSGTTPQTLQQGIKSIPPQALAANEQEFQDCLPCKLMGGATFIGAGAYSISFMNTPPPVPKPTASGLSRMLLHNTPKMQGAFGVVLIGLGVWRLAE